MELPYFPAKLRHGRKRRHVPSQPEPLTLVSAVYDAGVPSVTLTFNQGINTDDMDLAAIEVQDLSFDEYLYRGFTTTGLTDTSVTIELEPIEKRFGSGVTLNVGVTNGIVAASDGAAWAGVSDLELPFP